MTEIVAALADVSGRYRALWCDLWGCLHNGRAPFAPAVEALRAFRAGGGAVVLLTNAPRPNIFVERQIEGLGVPRDAWDIIVSSGDATQAAMLAGMIGRRVFHIGPAKDDGFFTHLPPGAEPVERVPLDKAEGIVCTGPLDEVNDKPEDYRGTFLVAKSRGLKLLCANPDIWVDLGDRRILCAGALGRFYEEMGGETLWFGKPHPPVYDLARARLAAHLGEDLGNDTILAVGDGFETDIAGGAAEGVDTLYVTGGIHAADYGQTGENPDPARLNAWLATRPVSPTYAIGKLR